VTPAELVGPVLEADRELAHRAMLAAIPVDGPQRHLYELAAEYPRRGGKGFRASLCLAACRAFGGRTADALDAAVALELLHNGFLVHDDIQDGSTRRRGEPTLHVMAGVPLALNAGDGLCALALGALARCGARLGPEVACRLMGEVAHLFRRSVEGQATELGWAADGDLAVDDERYLAMVVDKTCWYSTIHPLRMGAIIGSRGRADVDRIVPFGLALGAAFQVQDDIENVTALDGRPDGYGKDGYGKDAGGDILEGKRTLLLGHLLRHATADERAELVALLDPHATSHAGPPGERVARVRELMDRHGSVDHARAFADGLAGLALATFDEAMAEANPGRDIEYLRALVLYLRGLLDVGSAAPTGA
jgi:geranylgeranyl diphosphate synthase type II